MKHRHIFAIPVENINTLMSLACFQSFSCVLNTSVRVASRVLVFLSLFFLLLLVQPSRETRGQFQSKFFGLSLVSASVEHVRDQRGSLFCSSPCLCADQVQNSS